VKFLVKPFLPLYHKLISDNSSLSKIITGDSYVLFQDKTVVKNRIAHDELNEDGHPSFCPVNSDLFVSDTYQDKLDFRRLFLFNIQESKMLDIAELKSSSVLDNTAFRCDLHPKWSYNGRYVSVDTVNEGFRQMYVYDVKEIVTSC
jgi:Tol biopolymer transport system component